MGHRLSKIYTKTGDDGTTGLGDGSRVSKDSLRVEAYGAVDEANSAIGVILSYGSVPDHIRKSLTGVQHDLFELGGELCIPGHLAIQPDFVTRLELELDDLERELEELEDFFLEVEAGTTITFGAAGVGLEVHFHVPATNAQALSDLAFS